MVSLTLESSIYQTRELSIDTWPDLEKLFTKSGIGDAWWCWCTFHHVSSFSRPENIPPRTRKERAVNNRREKRALVENGLAHGIIVYAESEPVGWCQFGVRGELPRIDHSRSYPKMPKPSTDKLWRVTCFVVDRDFRKRGVATAALNAAMSVIAKNGGGLVEAIPVAKTDQGPGYMYTGTVSMFKKAGFKIIGPFGTGRTRTALMRRVVRLPGRERALS